MKSNAEMDGLSARRWAIKKRKGINSHARNVINRSALWAAAIALIICCSCEKRAETRNSADEKTAGASTSADSLNKPKVTINVNRHYDKKGNLLGFDSTYSSYYSNIRGDTSGMDSLMRGFDSYFDRNRSLFYDDRFNNLFFNDSIRYPDFFHDDFFLKRYEMNDVYLRHMMQRMDSLKNHFFYERSRKERESKGL